MHNRHFCYVCGLVGLLALALALATSPVSAAGNSTAVKVLRNIPYYAGSDADKVRHRLDVYLPTNCKNFPVLFFVHGGAWRRGDKNQFGIYGALGHTLAKNGIAMVSTNYRLSPQVTHPGHIEDVAKAFAWTVRNIGKYGGDTKEIFVSGHSAGGHLSALLATNDKYLRSEGLSLKNIRGAIPVSGVYVLSQHAIFTSVFGREKEKLRDAAPVENVSRSCPPFLIIYADEDLPGCHRPVAQALHKALLKEKTPTQIFEVANRNHLSILFMMTGENDPVYRAMQNFILSHVILDRIVSEGASGIELMKSYLAP